VGECVFFVDVKQEDGCRGAKQPFGGIEQKWELTVRKWSREKLRNEIPT